MINTRLIKCITGLLLQVSNHETGCGVDPGTWSSTISDSLKSYFHGLSSSQPSSLYLTNGFPKYFDLLENVRSFHESYYNKILLNGIVMKRSWLSYSTSLNRVFCTSSKIFGLPKAQRNIFALKGSKDFRNMKRNIENHETTIEHIQAEISRGLYTDNMRIDTQMIYSANRKVSENQEILKVIIDVLLYLARQNFAFRGHNKNVASLNQGNFIELIKVVSQYHPIIQRHLYKINSNKRNRLKFMSHET
jgi:hypothetical protein